MVNILIFVLTTQQFQRLDRIGYWLANGYWHTVGIYQYPHDLQHYLPLHAIRNHGSCFSTLIQANGLDLLVMHYHQILMIILYQPHLIGEQNSIAISQRTPMINPYLNNFNIINNQYYSNLFNNNYVELFDYKTQKGLLIKKNKANIKIS